jgi:dihydrofolate synthase / folylpolyglutamate synthase
MTFTQAYNYILSLSNLPRKEYMQHPRDCSVYLKRLQFFLDIMGNPEKKIPHYIHVTGTSGKGSVTSFLHSILHASGKKTGSTYSPHPTCITERWKIGNRHMSKKEFVLLVEKIKPQMDVYMRTTPYDMLSFFEITEAIGFLWFAQNKIDWIILEVACGGRFDASNVIPHKDVAVITNIGLDHIGIIGNTKKEIAYEKAGIITSKNAVFTSEKNKSIIAILKQECKKQKAQLTVSTSQFLISHKTTDDTNFIYKNESYILNTAGKHQIKNAVLCIDIAHHLDIPNAAIKKGLQQAPQPLRMERISTKPLIILDAAHNPDKIATTVQTVETLKQTVQNIHLVLGFSGDKNSTQMIQTLMRLKPKTVACTRNTTNTFRKVTSPQAIEKLIKKQSPNTKTLIFLDPIDAFAWSKKQQKSKDLLLVTGSIFLSGEIRKNIY